MSREIKSDFEELLSFIKDYQLGDIDSHPNYVRQLSAFHKKYYAYLIYIAELNSTKRDENAPNELQFLYLFESCSDCGTALFNIIHGSRKSSKLLLRCSIENFLRGLLISDIPDIQSETNLYSFFQKIKASGVISDNPTLMKCYIRIHQIYKELCADVHTAGEANMAHISSLNHFPDYNSDIISDVTKTAMTLMQLYLSSLAIKYNSHYHTMNYINKEIIIANIPKKYRPAILLNETE